MPIIVLREGSCFGMVGGFSLEEKTIELETFGLKAPNRETFGGLINKF